MKTPAGRQHSWILAAVGALVVLLAILLLFRGPDARRVGVVQPAAKPVAAVRLITLQANDAALTDPTPLFLPTEWNAGQNALPSNTQREPGGSFQGYPPKLAFAETELKLNFPAVVALPLRPADALAADRAGQSYLGLGQTDGKVTQLAERKAFIEILRANDGQKLLGQPVNDADPPEKAWQPMEFLVAVDAMGMVGPPVLTESSRAITVDGYFRNYLVKTLHVGQRLPPGFYRVCIGP
jgi:hypothetical protein